MDIINSQIKNTLNAVDKMDGPNLSQINFMRKVSLSGLSTGQTIIVPANNGGSTNVRYIAARALARLTSITGTLLTAAILRIGNNVTFDNICSLTTLTGLNTVQVLLPLTLNATLTSVDISSTGLSVDVQTIATGTGLSTYNLDIYLWGTIE